MPIDIHPASLSPTPLAAAGGFKVVVIGASAGGIDALVTLLSALNPGFPLPILLVLHISEKPRLSSELPAVLRRCTRLPVKWAEHGERMMPGTVYIAPPGQHMLVGAGQRLLLSSAARVGWWRPSVDALFHSAAAICGARVIAIVLSGMLWDGAKGISAVAKQGGITIAQDEATSACFDMPAAALDVGGADVVMSPRDIARALAVLTEVTIDTPQVESQLSLSFFDPRVRVATPDG